MVGVEGREGTPLRIYSYVKGGYCKGGRRRVSVGGEAGREIEAEECEVGVCERIGDVGASNLRLVICGLRVSSRAKDVEVSHDDVVTTAV